MLFEDILVGKVIKTIRISPDGTYIEFEDDSRRRIAFETEGACCSFSWIQYFSNPENILNYRVLSIVVRYSDDIVKDDEVVRVYGYEISSMKGCSYLEFRNSSNGHYSGKLNSILPTKNTQDLVEITEDWEV